MILVTYNVDRLPAHESILYWRADMIDIIDISQSWFVK